MTGSRTNKILFFVVMLFMAALISISFFHTRQIEPLRGTYKKIEKPVFSWSNWFAGDYQIKMDQRTTSKFFLRSAFIKIRNHIDFNLFDKVNADVVVKGKENILFDKLYLESYFGTNFLGEEVINARLEKIKTIQNTLSTLNKKLLVVIAPSKAAYFPDYFPIEYDTITKSISNYDYFAEQLLKKKINHLDFNKLFLEMKDTVAHTLYPKLGTHWNNYARLFVWNRIAKNLEEDTNWNLPKLHTTKMEMLPSKGRDNDLYHLLNIYNLKDTSHYAYRTYEIDSIDIDRPNGLVVADSYYWGLFTEGFSKEVLNEGMYWYYNNTIHSDKPDVKGLAKDHNLKSVLLENDIIILLATAANLHEFPFGFEDDAYRAIQEGIDPDDVWMDRVNDMITRIKNNEEWFGDLKKQAEEENASIDSLLRIAAEYYLKQTAK